MFQLVRNLTRGTNKILSTILDRKNPRHHIHTRRPEENCTPPKFVTRIAVPTDFDYILDFMSETYFKNEPSIVNSGLASEKTSPLFLSLMEEQVKKGLTIIALEEKGQLIGAAVNSMIAPWDPQKLRDTANNCAENERVKNLMLYFAYLAELPNLWETHDVINYFECSNIAVHSDYQGLGIAKQLIFESWLLARDCGNKLFRIDCSSKYSSRISKKFGWTCVATIPFESYANCCGEFIFQSIKKPHDAMEVYIDLPLSPKKNKT